MIRVRPTTHNVKALWGRIKQGQFKNRNGVPRFQVVKDIEDPDILYITWLYDRMSMVRCVIDDLPAYLPDEPGDLVERVLKRIARRDLRPPSVNISEIDAAIDPVQRYVREAEGIFVDKLAVAGLDAETEAMVAGAFHETLQVMVGQKMFKGT